MSLITRSRPPATDPPSTGGEEQTRRRPVLSWTLTAAAAVIVFVALVIPDTFGRPRPGVFLPGAVLRIPLEGIVGAALLIVLPPRARRITALVLGAGLGVLTILKMTDMGFRAVLARRFDPVLDWPLFGNGYDYVTETYNRPVAIGVVIGAVLLGLAAIAVPAVAVLRLSGLAARYRRPAAGTVIGLIAAWTVFALLGTTLYKGAPVASTSTAGLAEAAALQVPRSLHDQAAFAAEAGNDRFTDVPASRLLTGLRGKDVIVSVVESYGRSALTNPTMSRIIEPALAQGDQALAAAGFSARSGWLTSSTYGGGSWLAHASFQSGLWIDNQSRYRQLMAGHRLTLTNAFHRAGWTTVGVEPGNHRAWPEASFYGYDQVVDSRTMGYRGPRFGWSSMPDQFTLESFERNVYGRPHAPLMAEITLTSSHSPWTPIPQMIDWAAVGDGSVYGPMAKGEDRSSLWQHSSQVRVQYARSIAYTMTALTSWVQRYGDDNLVMVFFGDHQPVTTVSGANAGHDIPITIVAKDRAVLDRIAGWGWTEGVRPAADGPVWKMDQFRDRFLTAFGTGLPGEPR